jgi:hypothetical protein
MKAKSAVLLACLALACREPFAVFPGGYFNSMCAERVTDPEEIATFAKAWLAQSSTRKDPSGMDEVCLYRLEPR